VSSVELDALVDIVTATSGVVDSTVNLVLTDAVDAFRIRVLEEYERRMGTRPEVYVAEAAACASRIEP
jgi:galactokinase